MILVIVESPAKCKKIENYLGQPYKCIASFGHIRGFRNGLKSIDYNKNYKADYAILKSKTKYVNNLRKAIKNANEVILATDDDREGEAIAWHICQTFKLNIQTTKRIIFHEITKKAILQAVNNPKRLDMNKVMAQQSRQILDLIVGFTVSPVLWKYISRNAKKGLSAGRCQTPALNLVYENEIEYQNHKGEKVYDTTGVFTHKNILFKLQKNFTEEKEVESFLTKTIHFNHILTVSDIKKVKKSAPKPLITSTLQQKASNVYNFSPKSTMRMAQILYENGYITYMRTDNYKYSKEFVISARKYIEKTFGEKYVNKSLGNKYTIQNSDNETKNNKKTSSQTNKKKDGKQDLAQEAHEAIRPTNILRETIPEKGKVGKYECKLYNLIWKTSVQSLMSSSIYNTINATITAPDALKYKNKSLKNLFLGWEKLENIELNSEHFEYLETKQNEEVKVDYKNVNSNVAIKKLKTHYTEARLVQLLEKYGIGRPSTFSSLVSKIMDRGYVEKTNIKGKKIKCNNYILTKENAKVEKKQEQKIFGDEKNKLVLQPVGIMVIEFLNQHFTNLFNYNFTKEMEDMLDLISKGELRWQKPCDDCREQLDISIENITNTKSLHIEDDENSESRDDKNSDSNGETKSSSRVSKSKKVPKKGIQIDQYHSFIIAKYGPVVKYEKDGKTTFKKVKKNIDIVKLKNKEIGLEDILQKETLNNSKELGYIGDEIVVLKNGKFGCYAVYKNKNISLSNNDITNNVPFNKISLEMIKQVLSKKNANCLYKISDTAEVRNGKWGKYVYYKTAEMKKPKFISLKKHKIEMTEIDMDWVYDNL